MNELVAGRILTSLLVVVTLLVMGCRHEAKQSPAHPEHPYEISDFTQDAHDWADSVAATMTLRTKVSQLFMPAVYARDDYWTLRQVSEYADSCVGGVILLKGDVKGASALIETVTAHSVIPLFIAIDAEWGLAMRLVDAPKFPANSTLAPGVDDQLMYDYGRELARECRVLGINMVLGPVVDVSSPGSFMSRRSLGDDPACVADLAIAYARGLEEGDVLSVAKHFPGHGSVSSDSHKRKGVIARSLNEMDSVDIYPFRKWIDQRLSGIMVGHLAVPSIDPDMLPAAVSPTVITDLLREDLGFSGLVLTDAINMQGAESHGAVEALKAGADIVLVPVDTRTAVAQVLDAVASGDLEETVIDEHVRKILFYKYMFGIGNREDTDPDTDALHSEATDSISEKLKGR